MSERIRKHFGNIDEVLEAPNLIGIQIQSYADFLQQDVAPSKRKQVGLQAVFKEVFPIDSYDDKVTLDFVSYDVGKPKLTALEAIRDTETYSAPLYVTFRLKDEAGTKEEKVYMGELPLMTARGTFVINGAERVVVSQLHRSPGVCFETSTHLNGKTLHSFRIIPDRGSWLEVQFDTNDLLYVYLDRRRRRRKFLATTFLRTLGFEKDSDICKLFYDVKKLKLTAKMDEEELSTKTPMEDVIDGEVIIAKAYEPLTIGVVHQLMELGHKNLEVIDTKDDDILVKSLRKDPANDEEEFQRLIDYRGSRLDANEINDYVKNKRCIDFGCGNADYIKHLISKGFTCEAYDGNPSTPKMTDGIGKVLDLSKEFDLKKELMKSILP